MREIKTKSLNFSLKCHFETLKKSEKNYIS